MTNKFQIKFDKWLDAYLDGDLSIRLAKAYFIGLVIGLLIVSFS
jgi:hypothetical protein